MNCGHGSPQNLMVSLKASFFTCSSELPDEKSDETWPLRVSEAKDIDRFPCKILHAGHANPPIW